MAWDGADTRKMRTRAKLTLENYIDFYENPQNYDILTIHLLNQIIAMHGFIKLHNRPKKELVDAMNSIDALLPPLRSTLKENISSCAFLTLEQVNEDLAKLEWQECPVQSIETLKSVEENLLADDPYVICGSSTSNPGCLQPSIVGPYQGKAKRPRSRKRKQKDMKTVIADSPAGAATTVNVFDVFPGDAAPSSCPSIGY
ncbi:uncharacterized protein LOC131225126 [Magnolia sinica]|uniref:uncharacterized protein LOC131225126 n=1 Tax=Magnolia sinica TaxID=86752 RepID=UPI00265B497E|nr:uncharacterized protein LOC131225126 [Magnolia sinica]